MLRRYAVTRTNKLGTKTKCVLAAFELNKQQAIICVDWDPFNPFSDYTVEVVDELPLDKYCEYGGSTNDLIYDEEQINTRKQIINTIKKAGGM